MHRAPLLNTPPHHQVTARSVANKGEPFVSGLPNSAAGVQAFLDGPVLRAAATAEVNGAFGAAAAVGAGGAYGACSSNGSGSEGGVDEALPAQRMQLLE
jgi:hypothetical protein